jgi:hypothetical protein
VSLTLQEEWQESDEEDQEDGDDASANPFKDGIEAVTSTLAADELTGISICADQELLVESAQEHDCGDGLTQVKGINEMQYSRDTKNT